MNDPISDMLARIKNGYLARHKKVQIPYSKVNEAVAQKLSRLGYIGKIEPKSSGKFSLYLNFSDGVPALTDIKRISRLGRRMYVKSKGLIKIRHRLGYLILTTPKGIKTHQEAIKEKLGGELICAVW